MTDCPFMTDRMREEWPGLVCRVVEHLRKQVKEAKDEAEHKCENWCAECDASGDSERYHALKKDVEALLLWWRYSVSHIEPETHTELGERLLDILKGARDGRVVRG